MLTKIEKTLPSAATLQQLDKTSVVDCLSLVCDFTCHYFSAALGSSNLWLHSAKSLTLELFRLDVLYELDVGRLRAAWEQGLTAVRGAADPELRNYFTQMLAIIVDSADVTQVRRLSEIFTHLWHVTSQSLDLLSALQEALRSSSSALLSSPWLLAPVLDHSMFVHSLEGFELVGASADGVCGTRAAALLALTAKYLLATWKTEEVISAAAAVAAAAAAAADGDDDDEDEYEDEDYEDDGDDDTHAAENGDMDLDKPSAKKDAVAADDEDKGDNDVDDKVIGESDENVSESDNLGMDKSNAKEDIAAAVAADDNDDDDDEKGNDDKDDGGIEKNALESFGLGIDKLNAEENIAANDYVCADETGDLTVNVNKPVAKESVLADDDADKGDNDRPAFAGKTDDLYVDKPDTKEDSGRLFQEIKLRLEMLIDISLTVACIQASESYGCQQPQELQQDFRTLIGRLSKMEAELLIGWVIRRSVTNGEAWCLVLELIVQHLESSGRRKVVKQFLPRDVCDSFKQLVTLSAASNLVVFLPRMNRDAPQHIAELLVALLLSCDKDRIAMFDSKYLFDICHINS